MVQNVNKLKFLLLQNLPLLNEPVLVRFGSWRLAVTPDINCEADVKYPNKIQKGLCNFYEGRFLKIARGRELVEILESYPIEDMLVKLMFKVILTER